ncbi:MAG: protein kinase [Acidobacteriota bacterium]
MSIDTGTHLGRYEIRAKIGEGGMGEVYLAEDAQLRRRVALKILPAEVASNQDRMRRFNQEATAAAALNHPHIAHIYEIGESQGTHFIAMEFIEGVTLRDKIHHDKAPLAKLLKYLTQVAEGLAKAHSAGIVHRDLKPENIMVTRDGYAKILDFGLAKLVQPPTQTASGDQALSEVATAMMQQHSLPGTVMGTVGYMSPEQAQGRISEIDHRSDIFSFGCILFEAATQRKAFEGKDTLDSLHNIVHAPTPQIREVNPSAPDELQRIVRRCLAKEPEKRYQSIKEVAIELEELREEMRGPSELHDSVHQTASGAKATTSGQTGIHETMTMGQQSGASSEIERPQQTSSAQIILNELRRHKRGSVLALIGLFLIIGGAVFVWQRFAGQKAAGPARTMKIIRLTSGGRVNNAVITGSTSISPDGKFVVFALTEAGRQSLCMRQVLTGSNVQIVAPAEGEFLGTTISRDSEFVYYVWGDRDNPRAVLFQVPVFGGTPRKVLTGINSPITFSPDGRRFAFVRYSEDQIGGSLMVANSDGSGERTLVTRKGNDIFYSDGPSWSPDGKVIACAAATLKGGLSTTVVEVPVEGGAEKPLTSQKWLLGLHRVVWLGDGTGLILTADIQGTSGTQLWFISYPEGKARRITNDLNGYGTFSLGLTADNSTIVTLQEDPSMQIWTTAVNEPSSLPRQISHGKIDGARGLDWMPDGKIVYVTEAGDSPEIWIMNADGTGSRQLTADTYFKSDPAVSHDGNYVFFTSLQSGTPNIWRINADGSNLIQITSGDSADYAPTCSPDDQWITFISTRSGNSCLWRVSVDGGEPVQLTDKPATRAFFSPDGKLIACGYFVEGAKPPWKIAIVPFAGGQPVKLLDMPQSGNFWAGFWWTSDARAFFYADTQNGVANLWSQPVDGGKPVQITNFSSEFISNFALSRDGKRIALSRGHSTSDVVLIKDFK